MQRGIPFKKFLKILSLFFQPELSGKKGDWVILLFSQWCTEGGGVGGQSMPFETQKNRIPLLI